MKPERLIQLVESITIVHGSTLSIPLHRHQALAELIWVERGTLEVMTPRDHLILSAGELLLLPPSLWHRLEFPPDNEQHIRKLAFSQFARKRAPQLQQAATDHSAFTGSLFDEIERELQSGNEQKQRLLLKLLLTELDHLPITEPFNADGLAKIVHELEETCHLPFSLSETADRAGLSKFHFSRKFKEQCKKTPLQFVIGCRMDRAQQLLRATQLSVPSVAAQCGYKSATQFHAAFTRYSGMTPKRYRLQLAEGL